MTLKLVLIKLQNMADEMLIFPFPEFSIAISPFRFSALDIICFPALSPDICTRIHLLSSHLHKYHVCMSKHSLRASALLILLQLSKLVFVFQSSVLMP